MGRLENRFREQARSHRKAKKVTRRKGETLSSRYRSNGYVPRQNYKNALEQRVPVIIQR
jgi:Ni/Co efflux regulator RcnB